MTRLYDLHTHTTLTDGEMIPSELLRRMSVLGYDTVAITDHADITNISQIVSSTLALKESAGLFGVSLLCGVEITHVPPSKIHEYARFARKEGADVVIVHGETTVEPVAPGTNHAACTCPDVNILAHPGLITLEDARNAAENRVALEVTSRGGHNRCNGHVVKTGREAGCIIVVNSDAHAPHDLLDQRAKLTIALGAGLNKEESARVMSLNIENLFSL